MLTSQKRGKASPQVRSLSRGEECADIVDIGFISELMRFEERELGFKSNGIAGQQHNGEHMPSRTPSVPLSAFTNREGRFEDQTDSSSRPASARAGLAYARMRESLPPTLSNNAFDLDTFTGDSEQEIKGQKSVFFRLPLYMLNLQRCLGPRSTQRATAFPS